jgi:hypothetical protein
MATATGSPRGAACPCPARPIVVLIAGPDDIGKSRTLARWCAQLGAMHLSPKAEMYKQYAASNDMPMGALRVSPRKQSLARALEKFVERSIKEDRWTFDHAVSARLRTLGDIIVFVDIVDCAHAYYYTDFEPLLVYIHDAAAEACMLHEERCELELLRTRAYRVVAPDDAFPVSAAALRAYADLCIPLFPKQNMEDAPLMRTQSSANLH